MNDKRESFENFKSNMCHMLRSKGDIDFLIDVLEKDLVTLYYKKDWYAECLYTLAMIDYLCRVNNIPLVTDYDDFRQMKLDRIVYPISLWAYAEMCHKPEALTEGFENAIPEFKRFNIVENEVRNVV